MPTPTEIFEQASCEIDAGRVQEGARLAYEAAFDAVATAAARYALPCKNEADAREFLRRLDGFPPHPSDWNTSLDINGPDPIPIPEYTAGFNVARSFKEHAETPLPHQAQDTIMYWRPEEYAIFLPAIQGLIIRLGNVQPAKEPLWTDKLT